MDAPYVGEITTTNIKYAADGLYREETQMEVGSFFIRMAMGGNQIYGSILDGNKELRTVYNLKEEEYAQENFEGIRNNDGTPILKGMENSFGVKNYFKSFLLRAENLNADSAPYEMNGFGSF